MLLPTYALYPHMSARDNMAFGLKLRKIPKQERKKRVDAAGQVLGIFESLAKKPRTLSGGQRQRVAMGRAIVREPRAFLMDEPLSNLDAKLRVHMRAEIARIQRDLQATTIYVTHDQSEAMTLGDRVCVLRGGILQQVDRPQVLYERPTSRRTTTAARSSRALRATRRRARAIGCISRSTHGGCTSSTWRAARRSPRGHPGTVGRLPSLTRVRLLSDQPK